MDIVRPAIAGTLESSDCQVTVEKGEGNVDFFPGKLRDQPVWKPDP